MRHANGLRKTVCSLIRCRHALHGIAHCGSGGRNSLNPCFSAFRSYALSSVLALQSELGKQEQDSTQGAKSNANANPRPVKAPSSVGVWPVANLELACHRPGGWGLTTGTKRLLNLQISAFGFYPEQTFGRLGIYCFNVPKFAAHRSRSLARRFDGVAQRSRLFAKLGQN